jgi:hypothetical protein
LEISRPAIATSDYLASQGPQVKSVGINIVALDLKMGAKRDKTMNDGVNKAPRNVICLSKNSSTISLEISDI